MITDSAGIEEERGFPAEDKSKDEDRDNLIDGKKTKFGYVFRKINEDMQRQRRIVGSN